MNVSLTIKNYRCFPDSSPLQFEVREGFRSFVGVNNSGKSSILKFLYEFRDLFANLSNIGQVLHLLHGNTLAFGLPSTVKDLGTLFSDSNARNMHIEFSFSNPSSHFPPVAKLQLDVRRKMNLIERLKFTAGGQGFEPQPQKYRSNTATAIIPAGFRSAINFAEFLETMQVLSNTVYVGAFRNVINTGTNENYFDIQVGESFVRKWRDYKSGDIREQNQLIKAITDDIGATFELDLEINSSPNNQTLQLFVGRQSYSLNDLGGGLTQFIVTLANVAFRRPMFVLIDEPELNLHPSLQLSFLTTLASYAEKGILFSTHSIGLARAASDRVYAVRSIKQGESEIAPVEKIPRCAEFLGELGFSGYQELGFNTLLLVEGVNEVKSIQQFLRLLRSDHRIVLLPLGGGAMINGSRQQELEELKRITTSIHALIDSERKSAGAVLEADREDFVKVCGAAGVNCHVLKFRAFENYLSDAAVKTVKGSSYRAPAPYEKLKDMNPTWGKSENWLIARHMKLSELKGTDLLEFLEKL